MITVERTQSFDIATQTETSSVFVKLHVTARTSGLIGALGPERWQTLCVLATFMNERGECFPSAEEVAKAIDRTVDVAERRLKALCEFEWGGRRIVTRVKLRRAGAQFANYRYTILPVAQLSIFGGEVEPPDVHVACTPDVDAPQPPDVDVGLTRTSNNKIHKELEERSADEKSVAKYTARDVLAHFCRRYEERYGDKYKARKGADGGAIKNQLLPLYGAEKLVQIIDTAFDLYSAKWANARYPRPSIGWLNSWGANAVLPFLPASDTRPTPPSDTTDSAALTLDEMRARGLLS